MAVNLIGLIRRLAPRDRLDLITKTTAFKAAQTSYYIGRGMLGEAAGNEDRCETLIIIAENVDSDDVEKVKAAITKIFSKQNNALPLSTIHRVKGQEYERVFILDRSLIPSNYAIDDWQKQQEQNLLYVAITRSMDKLFFIKSTGLVNISEPDDPFRDQMAYETGDG